MGMDTRWRTPTSFDASDLMTESPSFTSSVPPPDRKVTSKESVRYPGNVGIGVLTLTLEPVPVVACRTPC